MSTDPEAKLFYGYLEPCNEDEYDEYDDETPWSKAHIRHAHGCTVDLYGYSGNLGHFLAVETALHEVQWSDTKRLNPQDFEIKPEWDEQLQQAAQHFGIDVTGLTPGWHLVSLYL